MTAIASGSLRRACDCDLETDGDGIEQTDLQRLVAAAALHDAELHAAAGLERLDASRQGIGADVDVLALFLAQEPEALFGVVPLNFAGGHGISSRLDG